MSWCIECEDYQAYKAATWLVSQKKLSLNPGHSHLWLNWPNFTYVLHIIGMNLSSIVSTEANNVLTTQQLTHHHV